MAKKDQRAALATLGSELTREERKEFNALVVKCYDPEGNLRRDITDAELDRFNELAAKLAPTPEAPPSNAIVKIKDYIQSDLLKRYIAEGAEFQGFEVINRGTDLKRVLVIREWLYTKPKRDPGRKAAFIWYVVGHQNDAVYIEAGRTIASSAYMRFQMVPRGVK